MMTDQLKYHLERQEDLEACCQLLSNILEVLYRKDVVSDGGAASVDPAASVGLRSPGAPASQDQVTFDSVKKVWPEF